MQHQDPETIASLQLAHGSLIRCSTQAESTTFPIVRSDQEKLVASVHEARSLEHRCVLVSTECEHLDVRTLMQITDRYTFCALQSNQLTCGLSTAPQSVGPRSGELQWVGCACAMLYSCCCCCSSSWLTA